MSPRTTALSPSDDSADDRGGSCWATQPAAGWPCPVGARPVARVRSIDQ